MKKTNLIVAISVFAALLIITSASVVYAKGGGYYLTSRLDDCQKKSSAAKDSEKTVDVANKICPVSGCKIEPAADKTCEYGGKVYHLCRSKCLHDFKKDPQKYIDIINKGGKGNS